MKPIRLKGKAMAALRMEVYMRDCGQCQHCFRPVTFDGGGFNQAHLAHIKSRGAGGSDEASNVRILCLWCHMGEHSYGKSMTKPVPVKERVA